MSDPLCEIRDDRFIESLLGRHLESVLVADRVKQEAPGFVSGYYGRSRVASPADSLAGIQEQPALDVLGVRRVTPVALVCEDRADVRFKERHVHGSAGGRSGRQQQTGAQEGHESRFHKG